MIDPSKRTAKIVAASLVVLGLAWQQVQATRLGYQVEKARHAEQLLRGRLGALQMQVEASVSPAQLAVQAKALGMIQGGPESLRILGGDASTASRSTFLSRLFPSLARALST